MTRITALAAALVAASTLAVPLPAALSAVTAAQVQKTSTRSAPVHLRPTFDSPFVGMIDDPDCSTISRGPGQDPARVAQRSDAQGGQWFALEGAWVYNNGFCI